MPEENAKTPAPKEMPLEKRKMYYHGLNDAYVFVIAGILGGARSAYEYMERRPNIDVSLMEYIDKTFIFGICVSIILLSVVFIIHYFYPKFSIFSEFFKSLNKPGYVEDVGYDDLRVSLMQFFFMKLSLLMFSSTVSSPVSFLIVKQIFFNP